MKSVVLSVRLSEDFKSALEELAAREQKSIPTIVQNAVVDYALKQGEERLNMARSATELSGVLEQAVAEGGWERFAAIIGASTQEEVKAHAAERAELAERTIAEANQYIALSRRLREGLST